MIATGRAFAMAKQCRRRGGNCTCRSGCDAESMLAGIASRLNEELRTVNKKLEYIRHEPCQIREDWQPPVKPDGDYTLTVSDEGDGWIMYWSSDTESVDFIDVDGEESWPFVEPEAWSDDWQRLGIEVA